MPILREEIVPGEDTFVAAFQLRDGEITYFENKVVLAKSRERAERKALDYLSDFFGEDTKRIGDRELIDS